MTVLDFFTHAAELQRPHLRLLLKMRGLLLDSSNSSKKSTWEEKFAVVLVFSENKSSQKIKDLEEIAYFEDLIFAILSHNLCSPLNGIIGLISENISLVFENKAQDK